MTRILPPGALVDLSAQGSMTLDGTLVDQIDDLSGSGNHATASGSARPTYDPTGWDGALPSIEFDHYDLAEIANPFGSQIDDAWVFIALKVADRSIPVSLSGAASPNRWIGASHFDGGQLHFDAGNHNTADRLSVAAPEVGDRVLLGLYNSPTEGKQEIWINGVLVASDMSARAVSATGIVLNAIDTPIDSTTSLGGIVIGTGVLSTADRQTAEGTLAHEWGISLPPDHPYKDAPPSGAEAPTLSLSAARTFNTVVITAAATGSPAPTVEVTASLDGVPVSLERAGNVWTYVASGGGNLTYSGTAVNSEGSAADDGAVTIPAFEALIDEDFTGDFGGGPGAEVQMSFAQDTYGDWTLTGKYDTTLEPRIGAGRLRILGGNGNNAHILYPGVEFPSGKTLTAVVDIERVGAFSTGTYGGYAFAVGLHCRDDGHQPIETGSSGANLKANSGYYAVWGHYPQSGGWHLSLRRSRTGGGTVDMLGEQAFAEPPGGWVDPQVVLITDGADQPTLTAQIVNDGAVLAEVVYQDTSADRLPSGGHVSVYVGNHQVDGEKAISRVRVIGEASPVTPPLGEVEGAAVLQSALFIRAKDSEGNPVSIGAWTGQGNVNLTIDGTPQGTYYGGALLQHDEFESRFENTVGEISAEIAFAGEIRDFLESHEIASAEVEMHRIVMNPINGAIAGTMCMFRGFVSGLVSQHLERATSAVLKMEEATTVLQITSGLNWNHASQTRLFPGDDFLKYAGWVDVDIVMGGGEPVHIARSS